MMPHGMQVQAHAFSHQQDPFLYNPQPHHPHQQPNLPQQHAGIQQQYGRIAAGGNANASNPSLALGGGGGVDRLTANSLAAAAGMGNMAGASGGERTLATTGATDGANPEFAGDDSRKTMEFIVQLLNPNTRETALLELSKKREAVPELALVLWHSFGMVLGMVMAMDMTTCFVRADG
jgi:CCR4-NOT transcription complex subunit 9